MSLAPVLLVALSASAAPAGHVEAALLSETQSIQPGKPFTVALELQMKDGWHTCWPNTGDSGMATAIRWALPEGFPAGHVEAAFLSETQSIQPGKPFTVALELKMKDGWHTYWRNPGDSGMATAIRWALPEGFSAGPIQWPYPSRIEGQSLASFGYRG